MYIYDCYRAADIRHGYWTRPYFDCNGFVKKWVVTYAAPFFGWDSLRTKLEFKGVVTVTMDLQTLDVNQCPGKYYTPNAFKETNKCDLKTSYVSLWFNISNICYNHITFFFVYTISFSVSRS